MRKALNVSLGLIVRRQMSQEYLQHQHHHWGLALAMPVPLNYKHLTTAQQRCLGSGSLR